MAKAGSCSIGLRPNPSFGIGNKWLKGFDVFKRNKKKPIIIICWKNNVRILYFFGCLLDLIKNKKINKVKTNNQSNKLPSWLPQVPEIL